MVAAAVATVLGVLSLTVFYKKQSTWTIRLLACVVALGIWISAQIYKEFTGEGWDDVARHYIALGTCHFLTVCKHHPHVSNDDRVIADTTETIKFDPRKLPLAYINRANAYLAKRDSLAAIDDYSEAIKLDPKIAAAYAGRAKAYRSRGRDDLAIPDYDQLISLDPALAVAYLNRAEAYLDHGDDNRAILDYGLAIQLDSHLPVAYANRAWLYLKKSDYRNAIADATEAIKINRRMAVAYGNRALAYVRKSDYENAIADYEEARRLDPKMGDAFAGRAYFEEGNSFIYHDRAIPLSNEMTVAYASRGTP
jgi:tetratricopeptide (TPR) repeat protein